jgi:hypothetical protein
MKAFAGAPTRRRKLGGSEIDLDAVRQPCVRPPRQCPPGDTLADHYAHRLVAAQSPEVEKLSRSDYNFVLCERYSSLVGESIVSKDDGTGKME